MLISTAFRNDIISGAFFISPNFKEVKQMKNQKLLALIEGAVMVALATVLCFIRIFRFPWGGSITLLSMLPIVIFSIRRGVGMGLCAGFVFSLIQFLQGVIDGLFGWGITGALLVVLILFDYILPFTLLGIAGIFGNKSFGKMISGIALAVVLRYICHVISGAVVWHSVGKLWEAFSTDNEWLYSIVYNACYMLPELILTAVAAAVLLKLPQSKQFIEPKN